MRNDQQVIKKSFLDHQYLLLKQESKKLLLIMLKKQRKRVKIENAVSYKNFSKNKLKFTNLI